MDYSNLVPWVIEEFMKLKDDPKVVKVIFKRSEESGRVIYPSYVTRSEHVKRMKAVIFTDGEYFTGYEDMNWSPIALNVYYKNVHNECILDMSDYVGTLEGFLLFDKRNNCSEKYGILSEYVSEYLKNDWMAENRLLTDFPRFDWDFKVKFLNESLDCFDISDDLIYFAALVHYWSVEYFIDVPSWVLNERYYASNPIGNINTPCPVGTFKKHNYYIDLNSLERL